MDRTAEYREIVKRIIRDYGSLKPSYGDIEVEVIFDESSDHYELTWVGWEGVKRVDGSILHIDLRGGKVWIQHDGTEDGIANDLLKAGVPRDQIVLAFHHPNKRPHTDFAVS